MTIAKRGVALDQVTTVSTSLPSTRAGERGTRETLADVGGDFGHGDRAVEGSLAAVG